MTDTENKEKRKGLLYLLKLSVELAVAVGLPKIGAYVAEPLGEFGRAKASDLGWLLGLFVGLLAIYLVESATIGFLWPQPKAADHKPSWMLIAIVTCVAAGGVGGLFFYGRLGGMISGGLVAVCIWAIPIAFNRLRRRKA